jgi:hypothetical protein
MKKVSTTSTVLPPTNTGAVGKAWDEMSASFDRFCLAAGVEALGAMLEKDAQEACGAKSRATLTPPAKSHSALISLGKNGIEGVIYRVQPCPHPGIGFTQAINEMLQPWRGSQLNAISHQSPLR